MSDLHILEQFESLAFALQQAEERGARVAAPRRRWLGGGNSDPEEHGLAGDQRAWMMPPPIWKAIAQQEAQDEAMKQDVFENIEGIK